MSISEIIAEKEVLELASSTIMTIQQSRYFLEILRDWQWKFRLNDEEVARIKQIALEASAAGGYEPPLALLALYSLVRAGLS